MPFRALKLVGNSGSPSRFAKVMQLEPGAKTAQGIVNKREDGLNHTFYTAATKHGTASWSKALFGAL
jgi:hypothetical protein